VLLRGSRWLLGDGRSLNIWEDRWLPRPRTFKPVTPRNERYANWRVGDLIDHDNVTWRESLVRDIFLPYDAECILSIPLCGSWPADNLIWHYSTHGLFSVRSAYHMLVEDCHASLASTSTNGLNIWKVLWKCDVPPRIRLFGWRVCAGILPTSANIARRVLGSSMSCSVCGHAEESDVHAIFECPLAVQIWDGCGLDGKLWATRYRSLRDCLEQTCASLDCE